jgi:hypothetical protein
LLQFRPAGLTFSTDLYPMAQNSASVMDGSGRILLGKRKGSAESERVSGPRPLAIIGKFRAFSGTEWPFIGWRKSDFDMNWSWRVVSWNKAPKLAITADAPVQRQRTSAAFFRLLSKNNTGSIWLQTMEHLPTNCLDDYHLEKRPP